MFLLWVLEFTDKKSGDPNMGMPGLSYHTWPGCECKRKYIKLIVSKPNVDPNKNKSALEIFKSISG